MAGQLAPHQPTRLTAEEERLLELHRVGRLTGRPPAWRVTVEALLAVRALVSLVVLGLAVMLAFSLVTAAGSVEQRLSTALQHTGQTVGAAGQAVSDFFNPTHPPRYPISQDTEFSSLLALHEGDSLGQSADYVFTLTDIRRRTDAAGNPDVVQYAIVQRQYRVPRETKIMGLTVHVDRGEQQYVLDRGETFRVGSRLYKVNWISAADAAMAVGVYRNPDEFAGTLAFDSN